MKDHYLRASAELRTLVIDRSADNRLIMAMVTKEVEEVAEGGP